MSIFTVSGDGSSSLFSLLGGNIAGAVCGGKGTCGKCRVRIAGAVLPPTDADFRFLSSVEISAGFRIACRYVPSGECTGEVFQKEDRFAVVGAYDVPAFHRDPGEGFGIAIDIGTTTIAMELLNLETGQVAGRQSVLNRQRRFGSDVLSRIQAANEGHADELRSIIRLDILEGIGELLAGTGIPASRIAAVSVAANTTMVHLLLGLSCAGLGVSPFTPEATSFPELSFLYVFGGTELACPVFIVPGISAFVGGDIVSGLAALELGGNSGESGAPVLFIDLGTNAEMVLFYGGKFLCTSAAAGPAFEGGNISCGTGSIPGAVSEVRLENNRFAFSRIGEKEGSWTGESTGLCGSGLLDFVACALGAALVRADGSIPPVCEKTGILLDVAGKIRLTAADIREFQLAKAAIRAGIQVLLESAGIDESGPLAVHLAGGFGAFLKESSALATGLFPASFAGKIHPAGNTSLAGAARFLTDRALKSRFDAIIQKSVQIELANQPSFDTFFIRFMEFPA